MPRNALLAVSEFHRKGGHVDPQDGPRAGQPQEPLWDVGTQGHRTQLPRQEGGWHIPGQLSHGPLSKCSLLLTPWPSLIAYLGSSGKLGVAVSRTPRGQLFWEGQRTLHTPPVEEQNRTDAAAGSGAAFAWGLQTLLCEPGAVRSGKYLHLVRVSPDADCRSVSAKC